jgi:hypothetical protein
MEYVENIYAVTMCEILRFLDRKDLPVTVTWDVENVAVEILY